MTIPNAYPTLNFDLGETADMLRQSVADFASVEIAPRAAEIDRSNQFPRDLWPKIGALGLHGITVEEEYGGAGLGYLEHCLAVEEMSRASAAVGPPAFAAVVPAEPAPVVGIVCWACD